MRTKIDFFLQIRHFNGLKIEFKESNNLTVSY